MMATIRVSKKNREHLYDIDLSKYTLFELMESFEMFNSKEIKMEIIKFERKEIA